MIDLFKTHARSLTSPPEFGAAIQPDDTAALGHVTRAIYVGVGGSVALRLFGGDDVTLVDVPSGALIPLRVTHVHATGTDAGAIVGLW
jgi:hypothetical protein